MLGDNVIYLSMIVLVKDIEFDFEIFWHSAIVELLLILQEAYLRKHVANKLPKLKILCPVKQ